MSMILYQTLLQYRIWIGGMYLTWFEYMTSDVPFKEKENEYLFSGTIGEAMEQGIALPDWCKKYELHRRILLSLDGEAEAGFSITPFEKDSCDMRDTDKLYCAMIWYMGTLKKAETLLGYLQEHMKQSSEVEVWHLFQGAHTDKPYEIATKTTIVSLDDLTAEMIYKFFDDYESAPCCMIVQKGNCKEN